MPPDPHPPSEDRASRFIDALVAQLDGDWDLAARIASLFLADAPKLVAQAGQALASRDSQALARAAHALKGSVANFPAPAARQAAERLEGIAWRGNLNDADEAYRELEREIQALVPCLSAVVARTRP